MTDEIFFSGWESIGRTILLGVLAYIALVAMLRVSGKRTLAKFNAFDFIITVAFGSTLATILLNKNVALAEGVTALAVLILLQYVMTWASVRSSRWADLIKSQPTLLYHNGQYLENMLRKERVTKTEILAAMRESNMPKEQVASVILETDGQISVLAHHPDIQLDKDEVYTPVPQDVK